jgi:hypothetical protein
VISLTVEAGPEIEKMQSKNEKRITVARLP